MGRAAKNVTYNKMGKEKFSSGPSVTASAKKNLSPLATKSNASSSKKTCTSCGGAGCSKCH